MTSLSTLGSEIAERESRIRKLDMIEQVRLEAIAELEERIATAQERLARLALDTSVTAVRSLH